MSIKREKIEAQALAFKSFDATSYNRHLISAAELEMLLNFYENYRDIVKCLKSDERIEYTASGSWGNATVSESLKNKI